MQRAKTSLRACASFIKDSKYSFQNKHARHGQAKAASNNYCVQHHIDNGYASHILPQQQAQFEDHNTNNAAQQLVPHLQAFHVRRRLISIIHFQDILEIDPKRANKKWHQNLALCCSCQRSCSNMSFKLYRRTKVTRNSRAMKTQS